MRQSKLADEIREARELAARASMPPVYESKRKRRSKSKRKKQVLPELSIEPKSKPLEEANEDVSFIKSVIGKYFFSYDEYKRRQRADTRIEQPHQIHS